MQWGRWSASKAWLLQSCLWGVESPRKGQVWHRMETVAFEDTLGTHNKAALLTPLPETDIKDCNCQGPVVGLIFYVLSERKDSLFLITRASVSDITVGSVLSFGCTMSSYSFLIIYPTSLPFSIQSLWKIIQDGGFQSWLYIRITWGALKAYLYLGLTA